ncbi:MAG: hypothetical protein H6717_36180 [Polyangiaceae bacterium]|nr:hypothetical protein [Polyangiaceae bacterium]
MAHLLACPFCRELFPEGETERCPECGVDLRNMASLPPSLDALAEEIEAGEVTPPEHRQRRWNAFDRGRGALLLLSLLGLALFFSPWVEMLKPNIASISAFDLARGRAGWLWGGAVGWFVMLPLVWTRNTVFKLRGVRIICALFASLTLGEVGMMLSLPPHGSRYVSVEFSWGWGIFASALVSLVAVIVAARLGGRIDDLPALPYTDEKGRRRRESSTGETLH